ncbi:MAG TPA: hypothetical protein VKI62_10135, partial [Bacteroidota bacterium]|nr:hypothetical protein [Bacteroidota bacterium]
MKKEIIKNQNGEVRSDRQFYTILMATAYLTGIPRKFLASSLQVLRKFLASSSSSSSSSQVPRKFFASSSQVP